MNASPLTRSKICVVVGLILLITGIAVVIPAGIRMNELQDSPRTETCTDLDDSNRHYACSAQLETAISTLSAGITATMVAASCLLVGLPAYMRYRTPGLYTGTVKEERAREDKEIKYEKEEYRKEYEEAERERTKLEKRSSVNKLE